MAVPAGLHCPGLRVALNDVVGWQSGSQPSVVPRGGGRATDLSLGLRQ